MPTPRAVACCMLFSTLLVTAAMLPLPAFAKTLCTVVLDADTGAALVKDGDCDTRYTPASTFKIPLAVMGFDSGYLQSLGSPALLQNPGDPDWGDALWPGPVDPTLWMRHSVVWYSQRVSRHLGEGRMHDYLTAMGYGNADVTGDPGKGNGLERSWIASSLKVSPYEQAVFLGRLVNETLPVKRKAMRDAKSAVEKAVVEGGWAMQGKTGMAFPRHPDGSSDEAHAYGWYVGWATRRGRTVVFATLAQAETAGTFSAGKLRRDEFADAWPHLAEGW